MASDDMNVQQVAVLFNISESQVGDYFQYHGEGVKHWPREWVLKRGLTIGLSVAVRTPPPDNWVADTWVHQREIRQHFEVTDNDIRKQRERKSLENERCRFCYIEPGLHYKMRYGDVRRVFAKQMVMDSPTVNGHTPRLDTTTGAGEMVELFGSWLAATWELQCEAYDADPLTLEGPEFADFVMFNYAALVSETAETMKELPWKPWVARRGRPDQEHRDRAVGELVDVLHFVGNLLVALRVDADELNRAYEAKLHLNYERQRTGYQGAVDVAGGS